MLQLVKENDARINKLRILAGAEEQDFEENLEDDLADFDLPPSLLSNSKKSPRVSFGVSGEANVPILKMMGETFDRDSLDSEDWASKEAGWSEEDEHLNFNSNSSDEDPDTNNHKKKPTHTARRRSSVEKPNGTNAPGTASDPPVKTTVAERKEKIPDVTWDVTAEESHSSLGQTEENKAVVSASDSDSEQDNIAARTMPTSPPRQFSYRENIVSPPLLDRKLAGCDDIEYLEDVNDLDPPAEIVSTFLSLGIGSRCTAGKHSFGFSESQRQSGVQV